MISLIVPKSLSCYQSTTNRVLGREFAANLLKIMKLALKIIMIIPIIIDFFKMVTASISARCGIGLKNSSKQIDPKGQAYIKDTICAYDVSFETAKGQSIRGSYYQAEGENSKTILICSGSHASHEHYTQEMFVAFKERGYNVLAFNYTGFGESDGNISEQGVYESSEAAYEFLVNTKSIKKENIICWGYSLGGAAALHLAKKHEVNVVLDRTFSKMSLVAYSKAPKGLKNFAKLIFEAGTDFNNERKLEGLKGRAVIVSASEDETMEKKYHYDRLHKKFSKESNFKFLEVDGGHHHNLKNTSFWFEKEKQQEVISFIGLE